MFLGANTPDGLIHNYDKITEMYRLKKLYTLKGPSGCGKNTFIKKFAKAFDGSKTFFYCSADPQSVDGVVLEDLGIAVIDGTAPHETNNGELIQLAEDMPETCKIKKIRTRKSKHYKRAFKEMAFARVLHKRLERYYASTIDFDLVNDLCSKLITTVKLEAGVINLNSRLENSTK